jgi:hypothetical protein
MPDYGVSVFFIASEHAWMLQGARREVAGIREITLTSPAGVPQKHLIFHQFVASAPWDDRRCGLRENRDQPVSRPRAEQVNHDETYTTSLRPCRACRAGPGRVHAHHEHVAQRPFRDDAHRRCRARLNWSLDTLIVSVPRSLSVSEAHGIKPRADIVWREDPPGDRYVQVEGIICAHALTPTLSTMQGDVPVRS